MDKIHIDDTDVHAVSPEGKKASMPLPRLIERIAPPQMDSCGMVLPDGVKALIPGTPFVIWAHQTPPRTYAFKWIARDSPSRFGPGTEYRTARIALPYLIVLALFGPGEKGQLTISKSNECFFRADPLASLDDELFYPALLNCSKFTPQEGRPLSWICTQHLKRGSFDREPDQNRRLRAGFQALMHCLLETGFNYSSEHHETSSWFTESCRVDSRITTVEDWEAASKADPLFVLDVPWLKTGFSVKQVAERMFKNHRAAKPGPISASLLARLVFNHAQTS